MPKPMILKPFALRAHRPSSQGASSHREPAGVSLPDGRRVSPADAEAFWQAALLWARLERGDSKNRANQNGTDSGVSTFVDKLVEWRKASETAKAERKPFDVAPESTISPKSTVGTKPTEKIDPEPTSRVFGAISKQSQADFEAKLAARLPQLFTYSACRLNAHSTLHTPSGTVAHVRGAGLLPGAATAAPPDPRPNGQDAGSTLRAEGLMRALDQAPDPPSSDRDSVHSPAPGSAAAAPAPTVLPVTAGTPAAAPRRGAPGTPTASPKRPAMSAAQTVGRVAYRDRVQTASFERLLRHASQQLIQAESDGRVAPKAEQGAAPR